MRHGLLRAALAAMLAIGGATAAHAQLGAIEHFGTGQPVSRDQPVTFTADQVQYNRTTGIVIASGHVEAWQNGHVLFADEVTFDRNTNVAAAHGNVVLLEPDGQTLFANYAELTQGMKEGVLSAMRAKLAENGRLAANGARRTGGLINELSHVVYSTCNVCLKDPSRPPFWEIEANSAVQDLQHKRIEFTDATLRMFGLPVAYFPYFSNPDPSVKRQSGFLIPSIGSSSHIGQFFAQPYYWVLDDQSDVTITPMITTQAGPQADVAYRRRFNDGNLAVNLSAGELDKSFQGSVLARGQFDYDDTWRYGFDIDRATSVNYIRDFSLGRFIGGTPDVLSSDVYGEGFGQGAYARLDSRFYQSLSTSIIDSQIPVVLPRFEYSYFGAVDSWGGRLSVDAGAFNILRGVGTNTRRGDLVATYERPWTGPLGDLWTFTLHGTAAAYEYDRLSEEPNFSTKDGTGSPARALPQAAIMVRWPFARDSGAWGTQVIEPIVQGIAAPNTGNSQFNTIPNEDSFDLEFTDANLFAFNRFPGIDRLEGGSRANVALHGAWYLGGTVLDGQIGQSYSTEAARYLPPKSGLNTTTSDIVGHVSFTPSQYLDLTYRTRLDKSTYQTRLADLVATAGAPALSVNVGYLRTSTNPYALYDLPQATPSPSIYFPRDEATVGFSSKVGEYRVSGYARRDLATNQMVEAGGKASFENECYILDVLVDRRYTSINNDSGSTTVLFQMTFKTVGQFGFHAF